MTTQMTIPIYRSIPPGSEILYPDPPRFEWQQIRDLIADDSKVNHNFTPEFIAMLREEGEDGWRVCNKCVMAEPDQDLLDRVLAAPEQCPACEGIGYWPRLWKGVKYGQFIQLMERCQCRFHLKWWSVWGDVKTVPAAFRDARLRNLAPDTVRSKMPEAQQIETIKTLRANPYDCYFIYGPSGVGKTHYSLALLETNIVEWAWKWFFREVPYSHSRTMFRVNTSTWIDQTLSHRFHPDTHPAPELNVDRIMSLAKEEVHICVVFDEIDKFKAREEAIEELFKMVVLLSEVNAQLIATSNHSPRQLSLKWHSPQYADPILRRFLENTDQKRRLLNCGPPVKTKVKNTTEAEVNTTTGEPGTEESAKQVADTQKETTRATGAAKRNVPPFKRKVRTNPDTSDE